jgi:glycosyltransferase involved in cell wall biosynthesis
VFDQLRAINEGLGIPTIIASQNVESLDVGRLRLDSTFGAHRAMIDFANELRCLSRFRERFAISKVEAAVLTGVGLSCRFYPYVPRGAVRAQLSRLAARRQQVPPDRNLFLLVGTASHAPTRRSLDWFIRHAAEHGLPRGAHVVVVGNSVQELVPSGLQVSGLEVRGRVPDHELSDLLACAGAALVPQRMGFGALTRISELACAGVPVVAFPHAAYAIDVPPGVHVLNDDSWAALAEAIRKRMECDHLPEPNAYAAWEEQQTQPIGPTLRRFASR